MTDRQVIRSIRKGSVQWSEDDRLMLANLLIKAGYSARIKRRPVPGQKSGTKLQMEYIVEFWEEDDTE